MSKQHDSQKHSYASWKFGTSTRADQAKVFVSQEHAKAVPEYIDSPGPGVYTSQGGIGAQPDSRRSTSESFGMGTSARFSTTAPVSSPRRFPGLARTSSTRRRDAR